MSNKNLFEVASRKSFRFPFKGMVNTEDLWDLRVEELDLIFKELNSQVKKSEEDSLLNVKTEQDEELGAKIGIVKYIVQIKIDEAKARTESLENNKQKQKIMEILSNKENEELLNKSPEELRKLLDELA